MNKAIVFIKYFLHKVKVYRVKRHCLIYIKKYRSQIEITKLTNQEIKKAKVFFQSSGIQINTIWHEFYKSVNGVFQEDYMPEDFYLSEVEPYLNRQDFLPSLTDKNLLEVLLPEANVPESIVMNINGIFYNNQRQIITESQAIILCLAVPSFIAKPSLDSGGGRGIEFINYPTKINVKSLFDAYKKDFTIQQIIIQHNELKKLNPTSINTIRLITYLDFDGDVDILPSMLRFGGKGSLLDNATTGGWFCGINSDGLLKDKAYNRKYEYIKEINNIDLSKFKIPFYADLIEHVKCLHKCIPYFKIVSWDFALDVNNQYICIEMNVKDQGTKEVQIVNRAPLFGSHTSSIISKIKSKT